MGRVSSWEVDQGSFCLRSLFCTEPLTLQPVCVCGIVLVSEVCGRGLVGLGAVDILLQVLVDGSVCLGGQRGFQLD